MLKTGPRMSISSFKNVEKNSFTFPQMTKKNSLDRASEDNPLK